MTFRTLYVYNCMFCTLNCKVELIVLFIAGLVYLLPVHRLGAFPK